ncbi:hypothetical protein FB451DRAFT_1178996 [Mycena latifolia]|nr:hypothetical protein FB451DRAFT_1178996 [Mycena latifolia]
MSSINHRIWGTAIKCPHCRSLRLVPPRRCSGLFHHPHAQSLLDKLPPPSGPYSTNQLRDGIMLCAYILAPFCPATTRRPILSLLTSSSPGSTCATYQWEHFQGISLNMRCSWREECCSYSVTPPVSAALSLSVVPLARARAARAHRGSQRCARPSTGAAPQARWNLLRISCWLHAEDRMMQGHLRAQKPAAARHRDAAAFTVAASVS